MKIKNIDESILQILRRFYRSQRRPPSYTELARLFGFSSKNAAFRLAQKLITEGYLEKDATGRLLPKPEKLGLPLVGYVQAGFPSPSEEELVDSVSLDEYLVHKPEASFLLKITGDSMVDAGILQGDLVIIERGAKPVSGDIVLANVDGSWTLKYYIVYGDGIKLVAANPRYPDIIPEYEFEVAGVLKAVMRKYQRLSNVRRLS